VAPQSQRLDESKAVNTWHAQVDEQQVELPILQTLDGLLTISCRVNYMSVSFQQCARREAERGVIIYDENP
jgi:hypothetical protein